MKIILILFTLLIILDCHGQMPSKLDTIEKTEIEPFNKICYLYIHRDRMLQKDSWFQSTGFFINDSIILTAAHNVHSPVYNKVDMIRIYPAKYYNKLPYDSINIDLRGRTNLVIETPPGYSFIKRKHTKIKWDFGIIRLRDIPAQKMEKLSNEQVFNFDKGFVLSMGDTLHVAGFPADDDFGYRGEFMTYQTDTCRGIVTKKLKHKLDTYTGNSGSPVWVNQDNKRIIVGVHTFNSAATLLDNENLELLLYWINNTKN